MVRRLVERTLAWLSKCRAILVRYDKKVSNWLADCSGVAGNATPSFEIVSKSLRRPLTASSTVGS